MLPCMWGPVQKINRYPCKTVRKCYPVCAFRYKLRSVPLGNATLYVAFPVQLRLVPLGNATLYVAFPVQKCYLHVGVQYFGSTFFSDFFLGGEESLIFFGREKNFNFFGGEKMLLSNCCAV